MKKLIISIIACFCCLLFVCACTPNYVPPQIDLTTILEEIKTEYYNANEEQFTSKYYTYTTDDISIRYIGNYNGVSVMFIDVPFIDYGEAITEQTIDGVKIVYSNGQTMDVYYEGNFYSLQDAFENGILTHYDLVLARDTHKIKYPFLYE